MKLIKCKNDGYMFNGEIYDTCPKCGTPWKMDAEVLKTMADWMVVDEPQQSDPKQQDDKKEQPKAFIVLKTQEGVSEKYLLSKSLIKVGRLSESDIVIHNPNISRRHAEIQFKNNRFFLVDVGSKNHTFLNGQKLSVNASYKLKDGDEIRFYKTAYIFSVSE